MGKRLAVVGLVAAASGLAASVASMIDMVGAAPTFCAESGCETVRTSPWAHPLGIPMPVFGIAFFGAMIALAFIARPRLRLALAITGGCWAMGLIALQALVIGAWCKLCMIADPAALVLAVAVAAGADTLRASWPRALGSAVGVGALTAGLAVVLGAAPPPPVPPGTPDCVAREQRAGSVTVVEFVDFECPFCRELHPHVVDALAHASVPVRLVRKMVPLPRHTHAQTAALAWQCAAAQGKGDAMAAALFAAPPESLTAEGCEQLATQVGCDVARYRASRADPATAAQIAADVADAKAAHLPGLPTMFIGGTRVDGADHTTAELIAMIDHSPR